MDRAGFPGVVAVHHRGEAHEYRGLLALAEDLGHAQVADIGAGDELAMGAGAAGMHHAFGNALAVETLQLLQQLHVLQQHRTVGPGGLRVLVVAHWRTVVTGQGRGLHGQRQEAGGQACRHQQAARTEGVQGRVHGRAPNGLSGVLLRPTKVRSAAGDAKLKNLTAPIRNINAPMNRKKK